MEKIKQFIRDKNIQYVVRIVLISFQPVLVYFAVQPQDLTSWGKLFEVFMDIVSNPYAFGVLCLTIYQSFQHTSNENKRKLKEHNES